MNPIYHAWVCQIDVTSKCGRACLYCSRYSRHLRPDQVKDMSLEKIEEALNSLKNWPNLIGIIGGEPVLHSNFIEMCALIRSKFPRNKVYLWTSGGPRYNEYLPTINETFSYIAFNPHDPAQKEVCKHQPLTVALSEVVEDKRIKDQLLNQCWVQKSWCPTINEHGSYFCEVAASQDLILNGGANAWPVVDGGWDKTPYDFQDQVSALCGNCGMTIPMQREFIKNKTEKFTPLLLAKFREAGLKKVDDSDVEIFDHKFTKEELAENIKSWYPGNYRGDIADDENCGEGRGFVGELL